jgi:methyltransferase (TIGR00027 family)
VILGAGLDSYAYRSDSYAYRSDSASGNASANGSDSPRVFEVDYPASQEFKRGQLAGAGIKEPDHVMFVPIDFERDDLITCLADHGFDVDAPAVISWLGVCMYLSRAAIGQTLRRLGTLAPTSELVLDYMLPPELRDRDGLAYAGAVAAHSSEGGEPWLSFFGPDEMTALLAECGFARSRQLGQRDAIPAGLWDRGDSIKPAALSMLAHATIDSGMRLR